MQAIGLAPGRASLGDVQLGLVAVEMSTGEVLYSEFWCVTHAVVLHECPAPARSSAC